MSALRSFGDLLRTNRRMLIVFACAVLFLFVLMDVMGDDIAHLDSTAYVFFVLHLRRPWLTPLMQSFSNIASPVVLAVMILVVEAFAPGRRPGICAGINLVLSVGLCLVLKEIVQRARPDESIRLVSETGYSFPSGHSMVAMAFFGFLMWMVLHYEKDRIVKVICTLGFACVILLIGMSRVYLGVHYLSDVLAGFLVTVVWLGFFTRTIAPLLLDERPVPAEAAELAAAAAPEEEPTTEPEMEVDETNESDPATVPEAQAAEADEPEPAVAKTDEPAAADAQAAEPEPEPETDGADESKPAVTKADEPDPKPEPDVVG